MNYTSNYDSYAEQTNVITNVTVDDRSSVSEQVSHSMKTTSTILFSIICVLGIPGNAFVIWVAGVKMKKSVTTIWYVNLAVADLLCCLTIPVLIPVLMLDYYWPYGVAMCKSVPTVFYFNAFSSVFTLTLISLDRLALVVWPVWAQNHRSIFWACLLCGLPWCMALLLSLPEPIYREIMEKNNRTECDLTNKKVSHVTRLLFGFLVPLLVIAVCYLLIARRVSVGRFKSQKALQIMVGVVTAFFICWMPYHTGQLVIAYGEKSSVQVVHAVEPLTVFMAYFNSCLNPVLYVFMGQDFKERVRVSLHRIFENAFKEDASWAFVGSKRQMSQVANSCSDAQVCDI